MPRNDYEERLEARRERLERAAERAEAKASDAYKRADMSEEATGIPFGQPILVGHHSERRHRAAIKRADNAMRTCVQETQKARDYAGRAASVGSGGISSDDPSAIDKLRDKLAKREALQVMMREANKVVRAFYKKGVRDSQSGDLWTKYIEKLQAIEPTMTDSSALQLLRPDFAGRIGFADYQLSNNNAEIHRLQARVKQLERDAKRETAEHETNLGFKIIENTEANRVQLIFDGKPAAEIRSVLKSNGFRWSPRESAWQRHLNNAGIYAAKRVMVQLTPEE